MNGLHSCKPGNEPQVGQVKTFIVEQRVGKSGKPYTKIRSAGVDKGGQAYKIMHATPTGHTDSYGNISFNLDIESSNGGVPSQGGAVTQSQSVGAAPSARTFDDRSSRIERQHSQEMALRYIAIKASIPTTEELRELIDWFQRDIGHVPTAPQREPEPDTEPERYAGDVTFT